MKKYIFQIFFVLTSAQVWESSFSAGTFDENNNYMGGSEVLQLVSHKNELFASVGYWQDELNIFYGGNDINFGWAQILKLSDPNDDWIKRTKSKLKTILEIGGRNNPNATSCKAESFMGIEVEGYVVQSDKDGKYPKNKVQRYHKSAQRISADDMQKRIDEAQANATPVNRVTL